MGFAVILVWLGSSQWLVHALAAVVAVCAVMLSGVARRRGWPWRGWLVIPWISVGVVFFSSWY